MFRRERYYPTVVKDVENDKYYEAVLGSPITVDEDGISCRTIKDGYTQRNANARSRCTVRRHPAT